MLIKGERESHGYFLNFHIGESAEICIYIYRKIEILNVVLYDYTCQH